MQQSASCENRTEHKHVHTKLHKHIFKRYASLMCTIMVYICLSVYDVFSIFYAGSKRFHVYVCIHVKVQDKLNVNTHSSSSSGTWCIRERTCASILNLNALLHIWNMRACGWCCVRCIASQFMYIRRKKKVNTYLGKLYICETWAQRTYRLIINQWRTAVISSSEAALF